MRYLKSLIAAVVLLPAVCVAAEAAEPTNFAMEIVLSEQPQPGGAVVVRCLEGCDWTERAIQCPAEQGDCRAVIAGRRLDTAQSVAARQPKARPLPDSQCLGLQVITDPPGTRKQHCKNIEEKGVTRTSCYSEEVPAADSRAFVNDVAPKSPAELAGLSPGDAIVSMNGVPIKGRMELFEAIRSMKAGQTFDALLERDGAPMTVQGRVGIRMSDNTCAVPDARLLEAAATSSPKLDRGPFKLVFDVPAGAFELRCLAGCAEGSSGTTCEKSYERSIGRSTDRCAFFAHQEDGGEFASGTGDPKYTFPEPSDRK